VIYTNALTAWPYRKLGEDSKDLLAVVVKAIVKSIPPPPGDPHGFYRSGMNLD